MKTSSFVSYLLEDVFIGIHDLSSRAMFGGFGLYKNGIMFGLVSDDEVFFKVDIHTIPKYEMIGSRPFTYVHNDKKQITLSYWLVPSDVLENREQVCLWIEESYQVALRAKTSPKKERT